MSDDLEFTPEEQSALDEAKAAPEPTIEEAATPEAEAPEVKEAETPEEFSAELDAEKEAKRADGLHNAMHKERMKRLELEREIAELRAQVKPAEAKQEQPKQMPDPLVDPQGFAAWEAERTEAIKRQIEEIQNAGKQSQEQAALTSRVVSEEQQYMKQVPDYADAAMHAHKARIGQIRQQFQAENGYLPPDDVVSEQIARETRAIVDAAHAAGLNPAHLIYVKAAEMGYKKKAPEMDEAQRLTALAKAQENTSTLSTTGGEGGNGKLTAKQLAEMSEAEFNRLSDKEIQDAMANG